MLYPPALEPRWIDWNHSKEGGFRFVAYTDEGGEPLIGIAHLSPGGEMTEPPRYIKGSSTHHTAVLHHRQDAPEEKHLWRFAVGVDDNGLTVSARRVWTPRNKAAVMRVLWLDDLPAASFPQ